MGAEWTVRKLLDEYQVDGFIVLSHGTIVAEQYQNGYAPADPAAV